MYGYLGPIALCLIKNKKKGRFALVSSVHFHWIVYCCKKLRLNHKYGKEDDREDDLLLQHTWGPWYNTDTLQCIHLTARTTCEFFKVLRSENQALTKYISLCFWMAYSYPINHCCENWIWSEKIVSAEMAFLTKLSKMYCPTNIKVLR